MNSDDDDNDNAAYNSHTWVGYRQYIPGEPDEYIVYCSVCGVEDSGSPDEFPDLQYPTCPYLSPGDEES